MKHAHYHTTLLKTIDMTFCTTVKHVRYHTDLQKTINMTFCTSVKHARYHTTLLTTLDVTLCLLLTKRSLFFLHSGAAISHHQHHLYPNCEGRWSTTDDFTTSFLHFSLFSAALWDSANSRPVHSLMLSSHLFPCLPCLLSPFTVPCKTVLARPDERET